MDRVIDILGRVIGKMPGPGKLAFGALTEDRRALQVLVACMAAVLGTYLQPPVLSLYTPLIQAGIRDPGSGVPLLVAAGYLLLAVLTLVGGASGDIFGRRRFMLVGLIGVLVSNVGGLVALNSPFYLWANTLNTIFSTLILPMSVAIVTLAFPMHVRPFAYGALFGTQGVALVLSSSFLGIAESVGATWLAFIPAIALVVVGIRLIRRDADETAAPKSTSRRELLLNVVWAAAIFSLVYGLLAFGGGFSSRNLFLTIAICVLGFVIGYRWLVRRGQGRNLQLYHVRDLSLAIFAGIVLGVAQASFFYQVNPYFQKIQNVGPIQAGVRLAPFVLAMIFATLVIVRLSLRFGARRLISAGLLVLALGLASLVFLRVDTPYIYLIIPMLVMGFGLGIATVARTVVVLTAPPPGLVGMAAGINSAAGQSGFTLGILISSALVTFFADRHFLQALKETNAPQSMIDAASNAFQNLFSRAMSADYSRVPEGVQETILATFAQSFAVGLAQTFLVLGIVVAVAAVIIYFGMSKGLKASLAEPFDTTRGAASPPSTAEPIPPPSA